MGRSSKNSNRILPFEMIQKTIGGGQGVKGYKNRTEEKKAGVLLSIGGSACRTPAGQGGGRVYHDKNKGKKEAADMKLPFFAALRGNLGEKRAFVLQM